MKLLHNFLKKTSFLVKKMDKNEKKRLFEKLIKVDILRIVKKIITNHPMQ